ncbi:MAG: aromatic ring-hydroxylating dioxygenase subunit alpha, partial [Pseudomonadota bacterium]
MTKTNMEPTDWRNQPAPAWQLPEIGNHTMEGYRYTSRGFFQDEFNKMWVNSWLLLGRELEIPKPGDWQREEVGPESILMVRQQDGSVKAFYNVCQHRGNRLMFEPQGHAVRFACKYHGWSFLPDGALKFAQDAEDFPQGNPCDHLRLKEVQCETFAGFIWVNMNPEAESLKSYLGPVWDDWQMYEMENWKRYTAFTVNVPCNWKVIQDNFNESYHLRTVHPEASLAIEEAYDETQFDMCEEGHGRMIMRAGYPARSLKKENRNNARLTDWMRRWGLDPDEFKGRERDVRVALQKQKRLLGPDRGYEYFNNLRDEQLTDFYHYTIFPNFSASITAEGFHFLRSRPHPTDPERCIFDNWYYAPEPEGENIPVLTPAGVRDRGDYP